MSLLESVLSICKRQTQTLMMIITCSDGVMAECGSALLVPEIAEREPGYIKALTSSSAAASKHEFHALAQMAYYQYQDDEIEVTPLTGPCRISRETLMKSSRRG